MISSIARIESTLAEKPDLRLFLDYDGTLADFVPRPDIVEPVPEVLDLLKALLAAKHIHPAIVSGRMLHHLQGLIPLQGILLAGTYGLEISLPNGQVVDQLDPAVIRPQLDRLKPKWQALINDRDVFHLEDKVWTLAIHARWADEQSAEDVLSNAQAEAERTLDPDIFQIRPGHRFLEVSPVQADKGLCVAYLLEKIPVENATVIYMGDDDKDEQAFEVVQAHGGFGIRVCSNVIHRPIEDAQLDDPRAARKWLWSLVKRFNK